MKQQTLKEKVKIVLVSAGFCLIFYNVVGCLGYIAYAKNLKGDIFTNFVPVDVPVIIGMVVVAVKYMLTYPPRFFCVK